MASDSVSIITMWQAVTAIAAIVATIGICVTAYIAFKQARIARHMKTLEKKAKRLEP